MFGLAQKLAPTISRSLTAPTATARLSLPAATGIRASAAPASSFSCMSSLADRFSSVVSLANNGWSGQSYGLIHSSPVGVSKVVYSIGTNGASSLCQLRGFATDKVRL
jgi:hypothetical protein